jgi:hypothetical protein
MICANFGYNLLSGSGEEVENVKVYRRTTDNMRSEKLTQVSYTCNVCKFG